MRLSSACLIPLAVAGLMAPGAECAPSAPLLGKIECVDLRAAEVGPDEEALDISQDLLFAALKVAVTTDLPRLSLEEGCGNELQVIALAASPDEGSSRQGRFALSLRLELRRQATLLDNGGLGGMTVWDLGTLIMGRREAAKQSALDSVKDLVSAFIDDYHAAGNP